LNDRKAGQKAFILTSFNVDPLCGDNMQEPLVYLDGEFVPASRAVVSVFDHGLLYGDGVFEGIRAYDGSIFKFEEHLDRLYASAHSLMLEIPLTREEMKAAVIETLRRNSLRDAYIRLVVTRGKGDLGVDPRKCHKPTVFIIVGGISVIPKEAAERGIRTIITWVRRDPVDGTSHEIKSLNYLNSILAKIEANVYGVDEAIILTTQGYVCEGTAENIFLVYGKDIWTPPTSSGALPGITKAAVHQIAKAMGLKVEEKMITAHEVFNADEIFFSGTGAEIVPVREVNGRVVGKGKPGEITMKIREEFRKFALDPANGEKYA
jgi:branched-chain amino acid aminotransferase